MRFRLALVVALAALLPACAAAPAPERRDVADFRVGVTLRQDAERAFGPAPYERPEPDGGLTLVWFSGPPGAERATALTFDGRGRLARPPRVTPGGPAAPPEPAAAPLRPAAPAGTPCTLSAQCAPGGACVGGTCRRGAP